MSFVTEDDQYPTGRYGRPIYLTEMCSGSEAGSYSRLTDFVYHSTLGLRVVKKKKKSRPICGPTVVLEGGGGLRMSEVPR